MSGASRSSDHESQRARMLEAPIPPLVCRLAVPTILSMLVTSVYNMADTYFVSQIGTSASGAVGVVFSVMTMIQALGFMIGNGSGVAVSRQLGRDDREQADIFASCGMAAAVVMGTLLAAVGLYCCRDLIWMLGSTPTIYPYALDYARCILLGAPVMIVSFTLNNLLRWEGKANLAVIGLASGGILNIILDPILIFGFHMGILGAGVATLISQIVGMCILLSFFLRHTASLRLSPALVSPKAGYYLQIMRYGLPSFCRQGVLGMANMSLNFNAKLYGDAAVAALSIVGKIFALIQSIAVGFGQGFQPVLGFCHSAGRLDRVRETLMFSLRTCTIVLTALAVIGFVFATPIISLFRDDPQVIAIGVKALRARCLTLPLWPEIIFANMLFQSLGMPMRATVLAVSRHGLFIPLVFLLSARFGLPGLILSDAVADVPAFFISLAFLLHYVFTQLRPDK